MVQTQKACRNSGSEMPEQKQASPRVNISAGLGFICLQDVKITETTRATRAGSGLNMVGTCKFFFFFPRVWPVCAEIGVRLFVSSSFLFPDVICTFTHSFAVHLVGFHAPSGFCLWALYFFFGRSCGFLNFICIPFHFMNTMCIFHPWVLANGANKMYLHTHMQRGT